MLEADVFEIKPEVPCTSADIKWTKATYKVDKVVLVNTEILDEYLELYRVVEDY